MKIAFACGILGIILIAGATELNVPSLHFTERHFRFGRDAGGSAESFGNKTEEQFGNTIQLIEGLK